MAEDQNREALASFAKQIDNDLNPPAPVENAADPETPAPAAPAEQSQLAVELNNYMNMFLGIAIKALPSLAEIYTPQVVGALAYQTAKVCDKHGWLQDGIGGRFADELALFALAAPIAMATVSAAKHDIAIIKARKQNPDGNGMADPEKVQQAAA